MGVGVDLVLDGRSDLIPRIHLLYELVLCYIQALSRDGTSLCVCQGLGVQRIYEWIVL